MYDLMKCNRSFFLKGPTKFSRNDTGTKQSLLCFYKKIGQKWKHLFFVEL